MPGKREAAALARAKKQVSAPAQMVYAYAVVVMPSDGFGHTTARLLRFKVDATEGEVQGTDDLQDIVVGRAVDALEDQLVFR